MGSGICFVHVIIAKLAKIAIFIYFLSSQNYYHYNIVIIVVISVITKL